MKPRIRSHARKAVLVLAGAVGMLAVAAGPAAAANQSIAFAYSTPDWYCGHHVDSSTVELIFQCDGNLVLYRLRDGKALWATGTDGSGVNRIDFSGGRGKIYMFKPGSGYAECVIGTPFWDPGADTAVVQDDGNFVMYRGGSPVWASHTEQYQQGTLHYC